MQAQTEYQMISGVLVIRMYGELDHHMAKEIRKNTDEIIEKQEVKNLVFDFGATSFMDSSGIGLIMGRYKQIHKLGGEIYLLNVKESVSRLMLFSGLYKITRPCVNMEDVMNQIAEQERG